MVLVAKRYEGLFTQRSHISWGHVAAGYILISPNHRHSYIYEV